MKRICFIFLIFIIANTVSAEISNSIIQNALDFKESIYHVKNYDDFDTILAKYLKNSEGKNLSEEEKAFLKNVSLLAKMDFSISENQKELYYECTRQNNENKILLSKTDKLGKYFYVSCADIQSRLVNFVSGGDVYRLSMSAQDLYKKSLKIDKNFSPAHLGYGLWLFFAPPIVGGGTDAALKEMNKAVKTANTKIDSYLALVYRSQVFFKMGKKDKCEEDLKTAEKVFPNGNLVKSVREENAKGNILFN